MDYWSRVRNAFVSQVEASLARLEIQTKTGGGVNHRSIKCPFCPDSGGSASIDIQTGFLKCFQCGVALPLFDWVAKHRGLETAWDAAKALGEHFKIDLPIRGKGRPKAVITKDEIELMVAFLWEGSVGENMRAALKSRGFSQTMCEKYLLGLRAEGLIFPAVTVDGTVRPRAHVWRGPDQDPRWIWTAGTGDTNYLWPSHLPPRPGEPVWITEGEWDCMVLREHFDLNAFTWTGGASSPLRAPALPGWLRGREVIVCYDNDVWQGPDLAEYWADTNKMLAELKQRRKNLIGGVCGTLVKHFECKVAIAKVPIPANKKWGADVRDWWSKGGRNIADLELTPYEVAAAERIVYEKVDLNQSIAGKQYVAFQCRAVSIETQARMVPKRTTVQCPRGTHVFCSRCSYNQNVKGTTLYWDDMPNERAHAWSSRDPNAAIIKHIVGKPSSCSQCQLEHSTEGDPLYVWLASPADNSVQQQEVLVLSSEKPDLFSELDIEGHVMQGITGHDLLVSASSLTVAQREPIAIDQIAGDLRVITPWDKRTIEEIDTYLERRYSDLAFNVTKIRGQPRIHTTFDLVLHSPLWLNWDGKKKRGWIDAAIVGATRCGKSDAVESLHMHYGRLGERVSTQTNFSMSGLTVSHQRGLDGTFRAKPGVFPRNHNRYLVLDEFHKMRDAVHNVSALDDLQEARDRGVVQAMKASGSVVFPAAVRLLTISNPPDENGFASYHHPCEVIADLYRSPEAIARLDFALTITEKEKEAVDAADLPEAEHRWTSELCNVLVRRAWMIGEDALVFEKDAIETAQAAIHGWVDLANQTIPFVTGHEKLISVLRIATSIANICFSHNAMNPMATVVRRCHVDWAIRWLQDLWIASGFVSYAENAPDRKKLVKPFEVEWKLFDIGADERSAAEIFARLLRPMTRMELGSVLGMEPRDLDKWISYMVAHRAVDVSMRNKSNNVIVTFTRGGNKMLRDLIELATEDVEGYAARRRALLTWGTQLGPAAKADPNLPAFGECE